MSDQHDEIPRFTREAIEAEGDTYGFDWFRKTGLTKAARITGPFEVDTSEGRMVCEDGWLAIDSEGNPYPIADAVFTQTYSPAGNGGDAQSAGQETAMMQIERLANVIMADVPGEPSENQGAVDTAIRILRELGGRTVQVFEGDTGQWYWHRRAGNGEIVADSGEGYVNEDYAILAAHRENPGARVEVIRGTDN